ncbi:hypothetical protein L1276_000527 [Flavobacterium sp. HSC-32F16]|uniref:hypothetical protein n=1 Tax=Flavobacterium sp. HSC-32F16 TaxID=2910964 RepID=UPI0020A52E6E|nr:hypothetical protein [Flavobacterium sp. HSC-32F16]MCP2025387.1 hypothetical protein [Flavobacterium sp. HSC-32F16]
MKIRIILLFLSLFLFSCGPTYDCDVSAENYRNDECLLVVKKIPSNTDDVFDYNGTNPITKKKCDCNSSISGRWWALYKEQILIGDTIIKKKGELIFSIHKKDTILSFNFQCDGKVYK